MDNATPAATPGTPVATPTAADRVDAVIVGSGASGSVMAAKLAQAGKSVVILEGGPEWKLTDLISSQIWARRIKWKGPWVDTGGEGPIGYAFNSGWGTGGAALHHYAVWLRLHPEDFEMYSRFGVGLDWPLTYDELRPYYDQIQAEVGISGDAEAEVWRPEGEPYPMPPVPLFKQGEVIKRGFDALDLRTSPIPLAITTEEYDGRPACIWDGWCDAGCPIKALANPLVIYLPQAFAAGATIRHNCEVTRVLTDDSGKRAIGVEYVNTTTGERAVQYADVVILSAFSVQNPRILLNSATATHPDGLANSSGLVGQYITTHISRQVFGMFPEDTETYMGVPGGQLLSQENYDRDPSRGYVSGWGWAIAGSNKPNDLIGIAGTRIELFGQDLHDFMRRAARNFAQMVFIGDDLPDPENRVTLSTQKDAWGMPLATLTHRYPEDVLKAYEDASEEGKRVFEAAGAEEVWFSNAGNQHIMGGTIMGTDPAESVTDAYGLTHDVPNLVITGPGLFPTPGAVNPTFTIHALTLRTVEYLIDEWSGIVA